MVETGSGEEASLCYGKEGSSGLLIWTGNVSGPSWGCLFPRRRGCAPSLLDESGTLSDPVCVTRSPCPPGGGTPQRPLHLASHLRNKRLLLHACDPSDPANSQSVVTQFKTRCMGLCSQQELFCFNCPVYGADLTSSI